MLYNDSLISSIACQQFFLKLQFYVILKGPQGLLETYGFSIFLKQKCRMQEYLREKKYVGRIVKLSFVFYQQHVSLQIYEKKKKKKKEKKKKKNNE
eukprot:TRINITY_DN5097_c0_g2_i1.p3 TRINITY_DN5097_c0_g2~~TRINITY_DN5097_c0_g2_i1.p3  ORF type:complete len:106 (+),score=4.06 TRINITY_DN5097_c0_g2_i1:32-319(+)